jgi:phage terminase small subunit
VEQAISKPLNKKPNAPRSLDDTGQRYWREYAGALIDSAQLFETDLSTLEDLCYWESLKHRGRDELPEGSLFMEYTDEETGRVSHTQPHAAFSNLKSIQSTIMALRGKLGLTVSDRSGLKVAKRFSNSMSGFKSERKW